MTNAVVGFDTAAIQKMFHEYVTSTGSKPRHTKEADYEVDLFNAFTAGAIPNNTTLQNALYLRMMDCAVEFEESGFIAGVQFALLSITELKRVPGDGSTSTHPEPETKPQEAIQGEQKPLNSNHSVKAEQGPGRAEKPVGTVAISSRQIAELFETSNAKVVRRIEEAIMPRLDAQSQQYFRMDIEYTQQHRRYKVYYLNKTACDLYLAEMEPHKKYVNIAGGLVKMRELMKTVFPVGATAS